MKGHITYYRNDAGDNSAKVLTFIGPQPECKVCGGKENSLSNGPKDCHLCNSRLIRFVNGDGYFQYADWGDTIVKNAKGELFLVVGDDEEV